MTCLSHRPGQRAGLDKGHPPHDDIIQCHRHLMPHRMFHTCSERHRVVGIDCGTGNGRQLFRQALLSGASGRAAAQMRFCNIHRADSNGARGGIFHPDHADQARRPVGGMIQKRSRCLTMHGAGSVIVNVCRDDTVIDVQYIAEVEREIRTGAVQDPENR